MKIRIKFAKQGAMKFVGHLDIMRYFQKVMRRADVDIAYSEGFSPHQKMSFAAPLGVGLISRGEYFDIEVHSTDSSLKMLERLNNTMADGMYVLSYRLLPEDSKNAMSIVAAADYLVSFRTGMAPSENIADEFERFMSEDKLEVLKATKKSEVTVDIKPMILEYAVVDSKAGIVDSRDTVADSNAVVVDSKDTVADSRNAVMDSRDTVIGSKYTVMADKNHMVDMTDWFDDNANEEAVEKDKIFLRLLTGSENNLKPELVIQAFCDFLHRERRPFDIISERLEIYGKAADGALIALEDFGEDIV